MNRPLAVVLLAAALAAVACGGEEDAATTTSSPATTEASTTSAPASTATTAAPTSSSTTQPSTTTTETTAADTTLPGEPIEFGPAEGDEVAVIGVAHDDILNLRAGPGVEYQVEAEIPPLADDVVALGETRDIGDAFWIAVEYAGTRGWVNFHFTAQLGATEDATASIVDEMGERPRAETMADLGMIVAEHLASEEPPSDIVMVAQPTVGDLGEVTYDVVGLGDDAVAGLRVHVFGEPVDEGFEFRTVEVTSLCGRGVTDDGLCT